MEVRIMEGEARCRLLFTNHKKNALCIRQVSMSNTCRVIAVREGYEEVEGAVEEAYSKTTYSDPMTLTEARRYIEAHTEMLGRDITECVGLRFRDVDFADVIRTA